MLRLVLISSLLIGCGAADETTSNATAPAQDTALMVTSASELPECNANIGALYYVFDDREFQVCSDAGWQVIDLQGEDGADGQDGEDGEDGKDGKDGRNGLDGADGLKIEKSYLCNGSGNIAQTSGHIYKSDFFQVNKFTDGSYSIACRATLFSNLGLYRENNMIFYPSDSKAVQLEKRLVCPMVVLNVDFDLTSIEANTIYNPDPSIHEYSDCELSYEAQ